MLQEVSHLLMHKAFSYSWQAAMPSASPLLINLTLSLISYICYPLTKKSFARRGSFYCLRRNHKSQLSHLCFLFVASLIFLFCCQSAADMPFLLIQIQECAHLSVERRTDLFQTHRYIFMYGGFGNAEPLGRFANRAFLFDHVYGKLDTPFARRHRSIFRSDCFFQLNPSVRHCYQMVCGGGDGYAFVPRLVCIFKRRGDDPYTGESECRRKFFRRKLIGHQTLDVRKCSDPV